MPHRSHDAVICGAGVIGMSLALELRRRGLSVLVIERAAPGREASHAAAGMLAWTESHPTLAALAQASYRAYPEFVRALEDESGHTVDLRMDGTLHLLAESAPIPAVGVRRSLAPDELLHLEPHLASPNAALLLDEASVDPRALCVALERALKHHGVDLATGSPVTGIVAEQGRIAGVRTSRAPFPAAIVVNCCGAWFNEMTSAESGAPKIPMRPVKGQMFSLVGAHLLRHTIRGRHVYLVPRSDGRLLVGATVEDAGFDKRVIPDTIQRLHQAAANLLPQLGEMKMLEAWAGLRPAAPDDLPVLGPTTLPGYFVASGHYRDGILLAPITARLMADLITGAPAVFDLAPFSPQRFVP